MWINNEYIKRFLNGTADDWDRRRVEYALEESEKREERRRREEQERKFAFLRTVLGVLHDYPTQELCPTDIQFILFQRTGAKVSNQRISYALKALYWGFSDCPEDLTHKVEFIYPGPKRRYTFYRYKGLPTDRGAD